MKCHYEVLDVPKDADDSGIKTAYRKLALKWHPDKNLDNSEFAKEQFQIVQQAYEVLSDRQERAWYDSHREQILRGSNSKFEDNSLDVFQYFTTTCFKGYEDDEKGFYTVYCNVFENIAKEDMEFMDEKEEYCEIPNFGNSKTEYEKVSEFYAYWLNYSTKKSYVWLDPYDITEVRDRRYIKLIEKENKKVRQKAKKERNEEIRNLVAFVRKRDKRVQLQKKIQEQKLLEDKKKRELLSKQKRLERQQLNESGIEPEWAKFDNVKSQLEEIEKNLAEEFGEASLDSDSDEEEVLNNLYCVACNKVFKTPKAFENHEYSKKHKENLEILKAEMLEEEQILDFNKSTTFNSNNLEENDNLIECTEEKLLENDFNQSDSTSIDDVFHNKQKKKKKARNVLSTDIQHDSDMEMMIPKEPDNSFEIDANKRPKKKNKNNAESAQNTSKEINNIQKNKREKKTKKENETGLMNLDTDHNCVTCKTNFASKNKLFDHLKKTGHGVYIPSDIKKNRKKAAREK